MKCRIDPGVTFLPICACGWRGAPTLTRIKALCQAREHEERAHYGDRDVADQLWAARRRAAARAPET